jgi:hypothetical protein
MAYFQVKKDIIKKMSSRLGLQKEVTPPIASLWAFGESA